MPPSSAAITWAATSFTVQAPHSDGVASWAWVSPSTRSASARRSTAISAKGSSTSAMFPAARSAPAAYAALRVVAITAALSRDGYEASRNNDQGQPCHEDGGQVGALAVDEVGDHA